MRQKTNRSAKLLEYAHAYRSYIFTLCTVLICVVLTLPVFHERFNSWELKILDARFEFRGPVDVDSDIVIVSIDETSLDPEILTPEVAQLHPTLAKMAEGWPYDRSVYADVIDRLIEAGAKLVVIDIVFPHSGGEGDFDFADAIAEHKDKLILGYRLTKTTQQGTGMDHLGAAGTQLKIEYPYDDLLPLDETGLLGLVNVWPNTDGVLRQHRAYTSTLMEERGRKGSTQLDTLAYAAAKKLREHTSPPDDFFYINYRAGARHFDYVQLENLFLPSHWQNSKLQNGDYFKDKIVFLGPVAEQFKDFHPTPLHGNELMPGVEIHANILSTIRQLDYILSANATMILSITLVLALFAQLLAHSIKLPSVRALIVLCLLGIFIVVTQWLFVSHNTYIPSLKPMLSLLVLSSIFILYDFTLEQYERHRVRSYLDRYVTRNVADLILEERSDFEASLKGKRSEVCIFFSDIRGFTTLSESLGAEKLVSLLNEYFVPMVDIVLKSDGTLQKFIGDAIMAVWGDTFHMSDEDKAVKAVTASLEMIEALDKLNASIAQRGYDPLGIGIGLNFGEAIVGNIGHPQRMEFTVLGDAVNLAARLEGATKAFHQQILVGEGVYKLAKDKIAFRFVSRIQVKGKNLAVPVYAPVADQSKLTDEMQAWMANYDQAIQLYFARDFEAAEKYFLKASHQLGESDFLCQSYIEKCRGFAEIPPPVDWDGTDKLTTK